MKYTVRTVTVFLMMLVLSSPLFSQFSGGDGSEISPYEIRNLTELMNVSLFPDKFFVLKRSIRDSLREPLCSRVNPFTGNFNGNGFKITLAIKEHPGGHYAYKGLFSMAVGAEIRNVLWMVSF